MSEGDLLVDSESPPASPDLGEKELDRRITTVHAGQQTTTLEQSVNRTTPVQTGPVFARVVYDDDAGHHSFDIVKDTVTIGRGGSPIRSTFA